MTSAARAGGASGRSSATFSGTSERWATNSLAGGRSPNGVRPVSSS